ncbi:hypothetical protein RIF29_41683 [Crotalaria pallida]|uniref:Secreted protein n=1 Tax=Crotalaria pallida TaxID=3830 RepID=A0AAN9HVK1_CROPI
MFLFFLLRFLVPSLHFIHTSHFISIFLQKLNLTSTNQYPHCKYHSHFQAFPCAGDKVDSFFGLGFLGFCLTSFHMRVTYVSETRMGCGPPSQE